MASDASMSVEPPLSPVEYSTPSSVALNSTNSTHYIITYPEVEPPNRGGARIPVVTFAPDFGGGDARRWPRDNGKHIYKNLVKQDITHQVWSKTAATQFAKELGLWDEKTDPRWQFSALPTGYAIFEQSFQSDSRTASATDGQRTDRLVYGPRGRRIRSAVGLGRHLAWLSLQRSIICSCGCGLTHSQALEPFDEATEGPATYPIASNRSKKPLVPGPSDDSSNSLSTASVDPSSIKPATTRIKSSKRSVSEAFEDDSLPASGRSSQPPAQSNTSLPLASVDLSVTYSNGSNRSKRRSASETLTDDFSSASTGSVDPPAAFIGHASSIPAGRDGKVNTKPKAASSKARKFTAGADPYAKSYATSSKRRNGVSPPDASSSLPPPVLPPPEVLQKSPPPHTRPAPRPTSRAKPTPSPKVIPSPSSVRNGPTLSAEFDSITKIEQDESAIFRDGEREKMHAAARSWARVGDLVWTWVGQQALEWWPAIIVDSGLTSSYEVQGGQSSTGEERKVFTLELLALGEERGAVELEYLRPWVAYDPRGIKAEKDIAWEHVAQRSTIVDLVAKGEAEVSKAFILAQRVGKWIAAIQIRSPPSVAIGVHLTLTSAEGDAVTGGQQLIPSPPTAHHLSHSWIANGPETLHVNDLVRLHPAVDLGRNEDSPKAPRNSTCLMMRITKFIRGGAGNPLLARGKLLEMVDLSDEVKPGDLATGMEPPIPGLQWKCVATTVDLLVDHIAGRYLPLGEEELEQLSTQAQNGEGREEAVRRLGMGGIVCPGWEAFFPIIMAPNSVQGDRLDDSRLAVAEDAGMLDLLQWREGTLVL